MPQKGIMVSVAEVDMSELLKERSQMDPAFEWDLSTLFRNDEAWKNAFEQLDESIQEAGKYQGTLKDAESIKAYLSWEEGTDRKLMNVFEYANLRHSEDTRDAKAQSMYARAYGKAVQLQAATAFAIPEILSLSEETLEQIIADPLLKDHEHLLKDLLRKKAHTLSADEESLLAQFGEALAAPSEAATNLMDADLLFDSVKDSEGKIHEVTGSSYIPLQMSNDRTLRKNAFDSYYRSYRQHITTFSSTYSGTVKAAVTEAKVRHYGSSREMSMSEDNIPVSVYDSLIESVHANMDKMYRYVRLRKRLLKLDELHYYDLYAPLVSGDDRKYTYEQAQQMVLDAVAPLGNEYVERVRQAYKDHWMDVYPSKGKTGGAFSSGTYDSNPFILLNFSGSLDSVSTIAHEMGHSQHT